MKTLTAQNSQQTARISKTDIPSSLPPSTKRVNFRIYLYSLPASLSGLLYGLDTGSIGPITEMSQFRASVGDFSHLIQGVYVSSILMFGALASIGSGYLADRFSRKYTIIAGAVLFTLGAGVSSSVGNMPALFVSRAIYGIGMGLGFSTTTVYLVEIAAANQRGLLANVAQLFVTIGIMVAYFVAYASVSLEGSFAWRIPFILQTVVGFIMCIGMIFVPYSPRWLMQKWQEEEAAEALRKLRNVDAEDPHAINLVNHELEEIRKSIRFDEGAKQSTKFIEIFQKPIRRPTLLSLFVMGFQQLTGIDVILYFAPTIFRQAGFPSRQGSFLASGISGIINFVLTIPAQIYVDKIGRRMPLLIGSLIISTALLTLGSLYIARGQPLPDGSVGLTSGVPKYVAIISLYVVVATFASTWGPVGKIYAAEIIPNQHRARACAIQTWVNWTTNFIVALTTPYFLSKAASGPYFLYGSLTLLALLVLTKWMPETKGLGLERIGQVFGIAVEERGCDEEGERN